MHLCIILFVVLVESDILCWCVQEDIDTIDRMIADGEAQYNKWRHPDPYIGKWK